MNLIEPSELKEDMFTKRKRVVSRPYTKRAMSVSPIPKTKMPYLKNHVVDRRSYSLSPTLYSKESYNVGVTKADESEIPDNINISQSNEEQEKEENLPNALISKLLRNITTKKRDFIKLKKSVISNQELLLSQYAAIKELEERIGPKKKDLMPIGGVRVVSVDDWTAHDLLMLIREDLRLPHDTTFTGVLGSQVFQELHSLLVAIPAEVESLCEDILARNQSRNNKIRIDRQQTRTTNPNKPTTEVDSNAKMVEGAVENMRAKIKHVLELAKIPWLDREAILKKNDKLQRENILLQHRLDETAKKEKDDEENVPETKNNTKSKSYQDLLEELEKERSARESLKSIVSGAENMIRTTKTRIASLERQLKDSKKELEHSMRKHKELEQLYRHRETSYDARSKKLIEVSKTGEITIETLSRQRDALEIRVKELRDQNEEAERNAQMRETKIKSQMEQLTAKVEEQEKARQIAESHVAELEGRVKVLQNRLVGVKDRSLQLMEKEQQRCLDFIPSKENEPSDRETEIWKELQATRKALKRAQEDAQKCRIDKENFLESLSRIAQDETREQLQNKMATELVEREQKIMKLQKVIEELKENEKIMEQSMTLYENQLAELRLEVKRLRNYDCYTKEIPYQDLHSELLELQLKVETLTRERTALVTAAASRGLLLERHERAADLFAQITRTRRELAAFIEDRVEPPHINSALCTEVSKSLSSVCTTAADTWSALRVERARVLMLERAVFTQSLQLEREQRVRTQIEKRRAYFEREFMRAKMNSSLKIL